MPSFQPTFDLKKFRLEEHAQKALILAYRLKDNKPVDSGTLLQAILIISDQYQSKAYTHLKEILSVKIDYDAELAKIDKTTLKDIPLEEGLSPA